MKNIFFIFVLFVISACLYSTIINVPADQPTIQAGINAAVDTDTVLVQPGTYVENINYNGKLVTVGSLFLTTQDTSYLSTTIIDGSSSGSVVTFENGEDSTTLLCGFTITNGFASEGGGIYCNGSSPSLENLTISGNTVSGTMYVYGGGIYCAESNPSLENVTISGNTASGSMYAYGGGIYCDWSSPSLQNVTITDNSNAMGTGGGIYCSNFSFPNLVNSIFWNNSPEEITLYMSSMVEITYSDIEGGYAGTGNIDADPLFVDAGNGDYHLTEDSPCIDAGDPASPLDPDGTTADMGAWFYDQGSAIEDNEIENVNSTLSNYPNPFNPETTINYQLPENGNVRLAVYNLKGQKVKTLVDKTLESGNHIVIWNGTDENNKSVSSGIYFYKIKTDNHEETRKMILMK